jgi:diacylglycerol kinase family enzyme
LLIQRTLIIVRCYGFIYNPQAGDGRRLGLMRAAAGRLRTEGHQVREFISDGDPGVAADNAVREGCDVLVACGGDGTVNAVAQVASVRNAILGVLPLGTLNHFARDLGLQDLASAERALLAGRVHTVDAGMVNGHLFLNNSGIGIYPMMVLERERVRKAGVPRWPAFVVAFVKILLKMPFRHLRLEADGVHLARSTPFLFVGNNVYSVEGKSLGHRMTLDEGLLGIYTARHIGPTGLLRIAVRALLGTVRRDRDFTALTAKKLTVRRRRKGYAHVSLDGEVRRLRMPLEYTSVPGAIKVLAS